MYDHFIFLDTETSGLPADWDAPVSDVKNWPFVIQMAWLVCDRDGNKLKEECHYLENPGLKIDPASYRIHHIDAEMLKQKGESKEIVLKKFLADVKQYNPLLVAHFAEFDLKVLSAEILRLNLLEDLFTRPVICTMLATRKINIPWLRSNLSLNETYRYYFHKSIQHEHHALYDARAVAECFFKMYRKGLFEIEEEVREQRILKNKRDRFLTRFLKRVFKS